jgi:uncharacterized protein YqkB
MYEIAKINDDGTKTVVGTTDLNLVSIGLTYDLLENKVTATLDKYMESRDLKSEDKIKLLATTIGNIVTQSMSTVELAMKVKLLDAQIENERADISLKTSQKLAIESEKTIKENQSAKDLLVKEQQLLGENIKNGVVAIQYTYNTGINNGLTTLDYKIAKDTLTYKYNTATANNLLTMDYSIASATGNTITETIASTITKAEYIASMDGTKSIYELQKEVSMKQIEGFKKDMFFKAGGMSKELLYMLAQASATEGYEWNADVVKLAIEKMTDGEINMKTIAGDNANTTTVETSYTQASYDSDGTANYGLGE